MSDASVEYFRIVGAVLTANILTVAFVWCFYKYGQLEREGREHEPGNASGLYLTGILFVIGFAIMSMLAAGVVPAQLRHLMN